VVASWNRMTIHEFPVNMAPLFPVMQDQHYHLEGDVLHHLLQTQVLAKNELPYDEEFQLAALLHDVGNGLDARNHVEAGLECWACNEGGGCFSFLMRYDRLSFDVALEILARRADQRFPTS